jgi:hypothetical protein
MMVRQSGRGKNTGFLSINQIKLLVAAVLKKSPIELTDDDYDSILSDSET